MQDQSSPDPVPPGLLMLHDPMVRDGSGRVHGNLIDGWDGAEPPGRNFRQTASVKAEDLLRWAHTFAPSLSRVCVVRVEHP